MNIEELTFGQLLQISNMLENATRSPNSHSFEIGQKYFIRTVTMVYTGRLESVTDTDIVLSDSAWISDTGRFGNRLHRGPLALGEAEPYPGNVIIARGAIVDASIRKHELPREQK